MGSRPSPNPSRVDRPNKSRSTQVLIVIVLSLVFEFGQDALREKMQATGRKDLVKVMDQIFREIMILGFISLLLYIVTRSGVGSAVSGAIFTPGEREEEPEKLAESFEQVHMIIFCVMLVFIFQAGVLMSAAPSACAGFLGFLRTAEEKSVPLWEIQKLSLPHCSWLQG